MVFIMLLIPRDRRHAGRLWPRLVLYVMAVLIMLRIMLTRMLRLSGVTARITLMTMLWRIMIDNDC